MIDLSVVIVSHNTREMTLRCLGDLFRDLKNSGLTSEVIVVDNASADGSTEAIASSYPSVHLIQSNRNIGFGAANNRAFHIACGQFVLLLNSDAFVHGGSVRTLVEFLRERPGTAIAGPRLLNADVSLQPSAYPFPSPQRCWIENLWISRLFPTSPRLADFRYWEHDSERDVPWLTGACLLVRASILRSVGGFDEQFFMYAEETDWQKRIGLAGYDIRLCPAAVVTHLGGVSGRDKKSVIKRQFFESLDRYVYKHHSTSGLVAMRLAMIVGCTLRICGWCSIWVFWRRRRDVAATKVRLMIWLAWRQLTRWPALSPLGSRFDASPSPVSQASQFRTESAG